MNHQVWGEMEDGVLEAAATLGLWTRPGLPAGLKVCCEVWMNGTGQRAADARGK